MRFLLLTLCFCINFSWGNDRSSSDENDPLLMTNSFSVNRQLIINEPEDTIVEMSSLPSYEKCCNLPKDTWLEIMLWLSITEANSLSLVCKEMHAVYQDLPTLKLRRHLWKTYGDYLSIITTYPDLFFPKEQRSLITVDTFEEINQSLDKALEMIQRGELEKNLQNLTNHINTVARESDIIESLTFLKNALDIPERLDHYLQLCQDDFSYHIFIMENSIPARLLSFPLDDKGKNFNMTGRTDECFCSNKLHRYGFYGVYLAPTIALLTKFILSYPERTSILTITNRTMFQDIVKKLFIPRSCRKSDDIWWVNRTAQGSSYYYIESSSEFIYPPKGQGNYPNFISYIMNRYNLNETFWEALINKTLITAPWDPRRQNHTICSTDITQHNLFCFDARHIRAENDTGPSFQTLEDTINTECALTSWKIALSVFAIYTAFVFAIPKVSTFMGALTYQYPVKKVCIRGTIGLIHAIIVISYIVWLMYMFG